MRIISDTTFPPMRVIAEDSICATVTDRDGKKVSITQKIDRAMAVNRIVFYEDDGFLGSEACIGAAFLEMK